MKKVQNNTEIKDQSGNISKPLLVDVKYFLEVFKIPKERFGKNENNVIGTEALKIFNYH
jgi:hypothetical protein